MKRSILLSIMIIGAVAALVSGATFAVFSDSGTASGQVSTGNVVLYLNGDNPGVVDFSLGSDGCPANLGYGDGCYSDLEIMNNGSLDGTISELSVSDQYSSCFTSTLLDFDSVPFDLASGDSVTGEVVVEVTGDSPGCQALTETVTVTATLDQVDD
jgi:predicted ribosomally synthesized peptide with SipW-like signal peptide